MALLDVSGATETVVVAAKDKRGDARLVAYIAPYAEPVLTPVSLRRALREKLPDYMVPSTFVWLDKLPRPPQGKVDRQALPVAHPEADYVAPRSPVEAKLAWLWEQILGVERVGVRDDFFDLGGNSLLAVRVLNTIEADYGKRLPISTFYTASTVEELAELIPQPERNVSLSPLVKLSGRGTRTPFFFLHGSFNGGGFYCLQLAKHFSEEQPFYSLQPSGTRTGPSR